MEQGENDTLKCLTARKCCLIDIHFLCWYQSIEKSILIEIQFYTNTSINNLIDWIENELN